VSEDSKGRGVLLSGWSKIFFLGCSTLKLKANR